MISPAYRGQLEQLHRDRPDFGVAHEWWAGRVAQLVHELAPRTILDYGCGKGRLGDLLTQRFGCRFERLTRYDPGVPGFDADPAPADLLVALDVLEHVEPDHLEAVLGHMAARTGRAAFLTIAHYPAGKRLPDGRNAHLIVEPAEWWRPRLEALWAVESWAIVNRTSLVVARRIDDLGGRP